MASRHVTIVMATLNGARFLRQQLVSIAGQTHRDWSLFVSDDGSDDNTLDIIAEFSRNHPVRVFRGPKAGAAQNFLSALCHPDLPLGTIALADQDDVWLEGKLARALRRIGQTKAPCLYAAESVLTDAALKPKRRSTDGAMLPSFANALVQNRFSGHTAVINAAALRIVRAAGPVSGVTFHDWWLYQLLAGAGAKLVLDPLPMALYRQHDNNLLGGTGSAWAALRRLAMAARGDWGTIIQGHASALDSSRGLLTAPSQSILDSFLNAPQAGPGRVTALRQVGISRSTRLGTGLFYGAALIGMT